MPSAETIALLSQYKRDDFPRHWNPPPHFGYGDHQPPLLDMLMILAAPDLDPEIRQVFADKLFKKKAPMRGFHNAYNYRLEDATDEELARLLVLLKSIPEGSKISAAFRHEYKYLFSEGDPQHDGRPRPELSPQRIELLESLRNLAPDQREHLQSGPRDDNLSFGDILDLKSRTSKDIGLRQLGQLVVRRESRHRLCVERLVFLDRGRQFPLNHSSGHFPIGLAQLLEHLPKPAIAHDGFEVAATGRFVQRNVALNKFSAAGRLGTGPVEQVDVRQLHE